MQRRHPLKSGDLPIQQQISDAVGDAIDRCRPLLRHHRAHLPCVALRFDLRGQSAGQCLWASRHAELRFNLAIARRHREDFLATTVPHEVAHLVTFACHGRTRPHGVEWRAVMHHLGIADPRRCHDYALDELTQRRQRRWTYACDCRDHLLSTTRHHRAANGTARYLCRHCGATLRPRPAGDA